MPCQKCRKKIIFIVLIIALAVMTFLIIYSSLNKSEAIKEPQKTIANLEIGQTELTAEVVTTTADMAKGLGDRQSLASNSGMLFDYQGVSNIPGFWMKDMEFPLDLIWISHDSVVGYQQDVPVVASGTLPVYSPSVPVDMVLEVNAGFVQANGIKAGDRAIFEGLK